MGMDGSPDADRDPAERSHECRKKSMAETTPEGFRMNKMSLTALAREQLAAADRASSGRSAHTVYGGHEHVLRQTLVALVAGQRLEEHENPGDATVHVLNGRVRLIAGR